jgi:hypothetical protein
VRGRDSGQRLFAPALGREDGERLAGPAADQLEPFGHGGEVQLDVAAEEGRPPALPLSCGM